MFLEEGEMNCKNAVVGIVMIIGLMLGMHVQTVRGGETQLTPSSPVPHDHFGASVSIFANRIAVGATEHSVTSGSVYIYDRTPTGWSQSRRLNLPGMDEYEFGTSVSIDRISG